MKNQEIRDHMSELDRGAGLGLEIQRRLCTDLLKANKRLIEIKKLSETSFGPRDGQVVANFAEKRAARS
jgi:hypothetical protein